MEKEKYTNSKTFYFFYPMIFDHDKIYRIIKNEMEIKNRDIKFLILSDSTTKTYCFLEVNERIQTKDRFFLCFLHNYEYQVPIFIRCKKKNKIISKLKKNNVFSYYGNK